MDKINASKLRPEGPQQLRQLILSWRQQAGTLADVLAQVASVQVLWCVRGRLAKRGRQVGADCDLPLAQEVMFLLTGK